MTSNLIQPYREAKDGTDEAALVVTTQLGEGGLEHRNQLLNQALTHGGERLLDEVVYLGVILML